MSYWALSDIFEEAGPIYRPLHGGFGLCNFQGLRKPTWFAHSFLHRLGDEELETTDACSWVCRDGRSLQALIYDHTFLDQDVHDQEFFIRDLPAADTDGVELRCAGLQPGAYTVRRTRVGHRANDLFAAWYDLGCNDHLSRADVAALDRLTSGAPESIQRVEVGTDGCWSQRLDLRQNDLLFVEIEPVA